MLVFPSEIESYMLEVFKSNIDKCTMKTRQYKFTRKILKDIHPTFILVSATPELY